MPIGNFKAHFRAMLDTRVVLDPFGLGIELELLRIDADQWEKWKEGAGITDEQLVNKEFIKVGLKHGRATITRHGRGAKLSAEDQLDRLADQAANNILVGMKSATLEKLKPGIASVLIKNAPKGWPILEAACVCGTAFLVESTLSGLKCDNCGSTALSIETKWMPHSVEHALSAMTNAVDENGLEIYTPPTEAGEAPNLWDGMPLGDALATYVLFQCSDIAAYAQRYVEDASKN